jgi:hypothetical protein
MAAHQVIIVLEMLPGEDVSRATERGDFFIHEIVTKGQTLYERPD